MVEVLVVLRGKTTIGVVDLFLPVCLSRSSVRVSSTFQVEVVKGVFLRDLQRQQKSARTYGAHTVETRCISSLLDSVREHHTALTGQRVRPRGQALSQVGPRPPSECTCHCSPQHHTSIHSTHPPPHEPNNKTSCRLPHHKQLLSHPTALHVNHIQDSMQTEPSVYAWTEH